ncbi:MAG: AAA family ATPase [Caldilineaceae bacterium]|nr:AAA family ATPase [Caldilineaceae bacterium]
MPTSLKRETPESHFGWPDRAGKSGSAEVVPSTRITVPAFLSQQVGAGKTTLSLHVAYGLAQADQRVLLIGADQQASAYVWSSVREDQPFSVFVAPRRKLHKKVEQWERKDRGRLPQPPAWFAAGELCEAVSSANLLALS